MTPVRFAPEVAAELSEAARWYDTRRQGLGAEFLAEIDATLPSLGDRPRSFPRLQDIDPALEIRRALLPRFPCVVGSELCNGRRDARVRQACRRAHDGRGQGGGGQLIRTKLGLTQQAFAARFGFSINTLRHWEQGKRVPEGPTRAYLVVIARAPEAVRKALRGA